MAAGQLLLAGWLIVCTFRPAPAPTIVETIPRLRSPKQTPPSDTSLVVDYEQLDQIRLQRPLFDPPPEPEIIEPPPPVNPPPIRLLATFLESGSAQAMIQDDVGGTHFCEPDVEIDLSVGTVKIVAIETNQVQVEFQGQLFSLGLKGSP